METAVLGRYSMNCDEESVIPVGVRRTGGAHWRTAVVAAAILSLASACFAGPVLDDPATWPGPGTDGWTTETGSSSLSVPGYLKITFGAQDGPPMFEEDTIHTHSPDETGDFRNTDMRLSFAFYAEDVLPLGSAVYLHELDKPADEFWTFAFENTALGRQSHVVAFFYDTGWSGPGGAAEFWTALATVDWIGVNIARKLDTINQDYGLDDWKYVLIPEPGTYCMLGSALLSVAFTFRKSLKRKGPASAA